MTDTVTVDVPFEIGAIEVIATIEGSYIKGSPNYWNHAIGTWEQGWPTHCEDVRITRLRADDRALECPEWLAAALLLEGDFEVALLAEAEKR